MNRHAIVPASIASLMALALTANAQELSHPEKPTYKYEKCYGVARAGQNDCFTASNSCAAATEQDGQKDAWIYVPDGTCKKIVGGSLEPGAGQ